MNLITGEKFAVISSGKYPIIHCEGHNFKAALAAAMNTREKVIVVSHNSDAAIIPRDGKSYDYHFVERFIPKNVVKIYAQNCDVLSPLLFPIPIGIENTKWHKGGKYTIIGKHMQSLPEKKECLIYVNFGKKTNPSERTDALVTCQSLKNTYIRTNNLDYHTYLDEVKNHQFILCPEGNGLDTHRTWEALYMGSYPIVKRRIFIERLSRIFPMVVIDFWKELPDMDLKKISDELKEKHDGWQAYLNFDFWKDVIQDCGEIHKV